MTHSSLPRLICLFAAIAVSVLLAVPAHALLFEDFNGNSTTPYTFTNTSGAAPSVVSGGPTGGFARLANLNGSNNNSIAFDEEPTQTGPAPAGLKLAFSFRMSDDDANAAAGGCCGSAADGLGIGLYTTATYGVSGGVNPADGGAVWERPAHPDAFAIGLDIFQNIDEVNLNWGGAEIANADVSGFLDLNDGIFHRAVVTVTPDGSNAVVDMDIIEDILGDTTQHNIFSGVTVPGLNLADLGGYRVIAGGRTGGAFHDGDLDSIYLASIPEPSTVLLTLLGLVGLCVRRPRR